MLEKLQKLFKRDLFKRDLSEKLSVIAGIICFIGIVLICTSFQS